MMTGRMAGRVNYWVAGRVVYLILLLCPMEFALAQPNVDPWESFNRPMHHFNKTIDGLIIRPVALAYNDYLPAPAKTGVRNFFNNLDDVNVLMNNLLQLKFRQAGNDSGRLLINTTLGLCGLIDVADRWGMEKNYEDFGQTLGYWGVGDGGYLMLPILGSSTLRDAVGSVPDILLSPVRLFSDTQTRVAVFSLRMVDFRVAYLPAESMIRGDEYSFVRNAYMQRRAWLVADGDIYDEFDDF